MGLKRKFAIGVGTFMAAKAIELAPTLPEQFLVGGAIAGIASILGDLKREDAVEAVRKIKNAFRGIRRGKDAYTDRPSGYDEDNYVWVFGRTFNPLILGMSLSV
jgi:hypothetical protein